MDKRNEYVERLSAQMVDWDNEMYRLKDKVISAAPEARAEYQAAIEVLQHKLDEAASKLQGISTASDDEWEDLKAGTDQVWGEVRANLRDAILKIK
jgi:hypothetical protein